jgi:hypothetical protein
MGDYVRALMEIPGTFWTTHPTLYNRYRAALRASAATRRDLTLSKQAECWSGFDSFLGERSGAPRAAPMQRPSSRGPLAAVTGVMKRAFRQRAPARE